MLQDVANHILEDTRVSEAAEDATHHEAGFGRLLKELVSSETQNTSHALLGGCVRSAMQVEPAPDSYVKIDPASTMHPRVMALEPGVAVG